MIWTEFEQIVAVSLEQDDRFHKVLFGVCKKHGVNARYWPTSVNRKVDLLRQKMRQRDDLLVELAKAIVRSEKDRPK